ncbi:MAG: YwaF family protein [Coprobacillus sp.]|nr:YwaF family protein [Coprobacillus sp.]
MSYLALIATLLLVLIIFGIDLVFAKQGKLHTDSTLGIRIMAICLAVIFVCRILSSGAPIYTDIFKLNLSETNPEFNSSFMCGLSVIAVWLEFMTVLFAILYPFFTHQTLFRNYAKTLGLVSVILNIAIMPTVIYAFTGTYDYTFTSFFMSLEIALTLCLCLAPYLRKDGYKIRKREWLDMLEVLLLVLVCTMPPYLLGTLFGNCYIGKVTSFGTAHIIYLFIMFVIFVVFFLLLRPRTKEFCRMVLLYMSLGLVVSFFYDYDITMFAQLSNWPLHLCNLLLILIPICLIIRCNWLYYFTLLIGVVGAFIAMLMPSYSSSLGMLSSEVVMYWLNHIFAFLMPIFIGLFGVYSRPKIKNYLISIGVFFIYFLLVVILDAALSTKTNLVDWFYVNSDYVSGLLGESISNFRKQYVWTITTRNKTLTYYPVYQILYYLVYDAASLVMYFIFIWLFNVKDTFRGIEERNKSITVEQYALRKEYGTRRLSEIMSEESKDKLVVNHLYKRYGRSSTYAVEDASFTAEAGQIIGFLGHNGAGKSTIIKCIVGMQPATSGTIEVNGYDVSKQSTLSKTQIGFVPDHYALYENLSGREYINYVADLYKVPKDERDATLSDLLKSLSMEDAIDSKINTYSHGMKQKTAIMAALIHNPKLWILDEPLTGLDPVSVYEVKECMRKHAAKGNIVFFSSHLIDVAEKLCDQIIIIKEGKILIKSPMEDIEREHADLEKFYLDMMSVPVEKKSVKDTIINTEEGSYFFGERKHKRNKEARESS